MKEQDKQTLRRKLVAAAVWFAGKLGDEPARYMFIARSSDGSTSPLPLTDRPTAASWKRTKDVLATSDILPLGRVIMMLVVDTKAKRALFEYVTPQWSKLSGVPGIQDLWKQNARRVASMVAPWVP